MRTPRPRPVPPGSVSPKGQNPKNAGPLRSGALEAMKEHALRRAAEHTDMSYKYADSSGGGGGGPFPGAGWEEVSSAEEFFPR